MKILKNLFNRIRRTFSRPPLDRDEHENLYI